MPQEHIISTGFIGCQDGQPDKQTCGVGVSNRVPWATLPKGTLRTTDANYKLQAQLYAVCQ